MTHWRTRYVVLGFLAVSAALLAVMIFFAVSLVSEHYVTASGSILAIFVCAFWWHLVGEELWWRWQLWRRVDKVL